VLYHLTKKGWSDVMLIERDQLTSGSTWHAAGGFHTLNGDPNVAMLQSYTVSLYEELERISGQSCGLHKSPGIMLADTPERMEFLKMTVARGRYLGMETEIISVKEALNYFPFIEEKYFLGALLDPNEGHLDPSGTTYAYAKAARLGGATIEVQTKVESLEQKPDGTWRVITNKGVVECEHVVNAGGLWAREVGRMVGIELPVLAMEHMYLVTDDIPEVEAFNKSAGKEIGHVIDFGAESYLRQEGKGMVLGVYEQAGKPWSTKTTPWSFGQELLQPDLDRIAPSLEIAFKHFPTLEHAGIKRVINGPFTFAPDGNPLVGPVQGRTNFWSACGVMAGFSQGGIMSASVALSEPESVAGFGLLSGRIFPELHTHLAEKSRLNKLHAFVGHGDFDNTLPVVWAERSDALLKDLEVEFESHRYPMDHRISPAMRDDFLHWLEGKSRAG
jgi:dimethylglycine dehydrogenase